MPQFPWNRAVVLCQAKHRPVYNDEAMFRGNDNEDLSGEMTMDEAQYLDRQNRSHMEQFLQSIEELVIKPER